MITFTENYNLKKTKMRKEIDFSMFKIQNSRIRKEEIGSTVYPDQP